MYAYLAKECPFITTGKEQENNSKLSEIILELKYFLNSVVRVSIVLIQITYFISAACKYLYILRFSHQIMIKLLVYLQKITHKALL